VKTHVRRVFSVDEEEEELLDSSLDILRLLPGGSLMSVKAVFPNRFKREC